MALYSEVAGEGPAVALVHEGICDSRMWEPQWEPWSRSYRLLRVDLRGFGRTPLEPGPFAHARDLIEAIEQQGIGRAEIGGASCRERVYSNV